MISIDTSLIAKTKYYYLLNTQLDNTNAYSSIEEQAKAIASGTKSTSSTKDIDYRAIIKALQLQKTQNRLNILQLLTSSQLIELLYLIDKEKLTMGLKFFTKEKLLSMIYKLPKKDLLKMLRKIYSDEELVKMMPIKILSNFLKSPKISHTELLKVMKELSPQILAQIYEASSGKSAGNLSSKELYEKIKTIPQEKLVEGIQSLSGKEMANIVTKLVKNNPDLMMEFPQYALFKPLEKEGKATIISSMGALDPDQIIKMLGELPQNLLAQVDLLVDPNVLSQELEKNYKGLLAALVS